MALPCKCWLPFLHIWLWVGVVHFPPDMSYLHTSTFDQLVYEVFHIHRDEFSPSPLETDNQRKICWLLHVEKAEGQHDAHPCGRNPDSFMNWEWASGTGTVWVQMWWSPEHRQMGSCYLPLCWEQSKLNLSKCSDLAWEETHTWLTHQPQAQPTSIGPEAFRWSPSAMPGEKLIKTEAQICN